MADPTASPDTGKSSPPGMPRWVKASAIIGGAVILLAVIVMVVSGGEHGPGMHFGGGAPAAMEGMGPTP